MLSSRADAVDDQTQSRAVVLLSFIKHGNFTKEANLQGKAPSKKIMEVLEASTDSELMPVAKDTEAEKSLLGTFSENEPRAWDVRLRKLRQYQLQTPRISTQTAMKWVAEAALDPKAERAVEIVEHGLAYLYTVKTAFSMFFCSGGCPAQNHRGNLQNRIGISAGHGYTIVLQQGNCKTQAWTTKV